MRRKRPARVASGAVDLQHIAGHQVRPARVSQSPALLPRRCPWERFAPKTIDPKEHRLSEATFRRPLTSRTTVVLQLEQGQLALPREFSLLPAKLQNVFPGIPLAVDDNEGGAMSASAACTASRFAISRFNCRAMTSVNEQCCYTALSALLSRQTGRFARSTIRRSCARPYTQRAYRRVFR